MCAVWFVEQVVVKETDMNGVKNPVVVLTESHPGFQLGSVSFVRPYTIFSVQRYTTAKRGRTLQSTAVNNFLCGLWNGWFLRLIAVVVAC